MEPAIYYIDDYLHLMKQPKAEPVATIVEFPGDKVNWFNFYEQKKAENDSAIKEIKVEKRKSAEFVSRGTKIPLSCLMTSPSQLNFENQFLGF